MNDGLPAREGRDALLCRSAIALVFTLLASCGERPGQAPDDLCGNGRLDPGEVCDGTDLGGMTCESATPQTDCGELACSSDCRSFETEDCHPCCGCPPPPCDYYPEDGTICIQGVVYHLSAPDDPCRLVEAPIMDLEAAPDATRLAVTVVDLILLAQDPSTIPLGTTEVDPRTGVFEIRGIVVPPTGFLGLVVEDAPGSGLQDFVPTFVSVPAAYGSNITWATIAAVTAEQEASWTAALDATRLQQAGCEGAPELLACGTWIGLYGYTDDSEAFMGIDGVTPLIGNETPSATGLAYLDPTCEGFMQPLDAAENHTTRTGMALIPGAPLGNYSGECADRSPDGPCELAGYTWPIRLGGSLPGHLAVQLMWPDGYYPY